MRLTGQWALKLGQMGGQMRCRLDHGHDHFVIDRILPLDHLVEHVLDPPGQFANRFGARQAARTFERMKRATQIRQRCAIDAVLLPGCQSRFDPGHDLLGLFDKNRAQVERAGVCACGVRPCRRRHLLRSGRGCERLDKALHHHSGALLRCGVAQRGFLGLLQRQHQTLERGRQRFIQRRRPAPPISQDTGQLIEMRSHLAHARHCERRADSGQITGHSLVSDQRIVGFQMPHDAPQINKRLMDDRLPEQSVDGAVRLWG